MKKIVLLGCLWGILLQFGKAQTMDEILQKHHETVGTANLKNIQTAILKGKMVMQGVPLQMTIHRKRPLKEKNLLSLQGVNIMISYDGESKKGWQINPMTGSSAVQDYSEAEIKQNSPDAYIEGPVAYYQSKQAKFEFVGKEKVKDKEVLKVKITTVDNEVVHCYFDPADYRIIQFDQVYDFGSQGKKNIVTYYEEYKEINGAMLAHKISSFSDNVLLAQIIFDSIEFNQEIDDKIFERPQN